MQISYRKKWQKDRLQAQVPCAGSDSRCCKLGNRTCILCVPSSSSVHRLEPPKSCLGERGRTLLCCSGTLSLFFGFWGVTPVGDPRLRFSGAHVAIAPRNLTPSASEEPACVAIYMYILSVNSAMTTKGSRGAVVKKLVQSTNYNC